MEVNINIVGGRRMPPSGKVNERAISTEKVREAVNKLRSGEAPGLDGIPVEWTMMPIFLSGCMLSGKVLNTFIHGVIIPLLKCKSNNPADFNNYRPSTIATALSKVLEQVLLLRLARYL